jgi:hypothetical protein
MPVPELRPENLAIIRAMSGPRADSYVDEVLIPSLARASRAMHSLEAIRDQLSKPYRCLEAVFSHYAFARRGRDRFDLSEMAVLALHRISSEEDFGQFLALDNAVSLWEAFVEICQERKRKPMEQLNSGVIAGMAELAQEIYVLDGTGSIAAWIAKGIRQTGRVEPQFLRMVDVRGVGPKITSLILRDAVYIYGLEELVDHADRLYIQPVDKWIRMIAPYVIDEPNADDLADWILAGKLAKYTRRAAASGIRFNMGATWFGMREVRAQEFFDSSVRHLVHEELSRLPSPTNAELR